MMLPEIITLIPMFIEFRTLERKHAP